MRDLPVEIEEAAIASGLVAEAVAVGVPDPQLGQAIHLAIRPAPGFDDAALRKALAAALPNFMQPRSIHAYAELPRNPNGKLDRNALADQMAQAAV